LCFSSTLTILRRAAWRRKARSDPIDAAWLENKVSVQANPRQARVERSGRS
jgi:hypothetical protein